MKGRKLALFEDKEIRKQWYKDDWYFSVADVVEALTDTVDVRQYVKKMRLRDVELSANWGTICTLVEMTAKDNKKRNITMSDTKGILRIIQSIPSPKAEPFKQWLATVGAERIEEINDPELAVERAGKTYVLKGYSDEWIKQRMLGIKSRRELTDEWKKRGAKETDYGIFTNQIYKYGFGMTAGEIKKELKLGPKANIRDSMDKISVALTNLGEVTAKEFHIEHNSVGVNELKEDTKKAGVIIGNTRKEINHNLKNNKIKENDKNE